MKNTKVNFGFISGLEGGPTLTGYVPDPEHSNSGVTIATGFDIGQRSRYELIKMFPAGSSLVNKLSPYCGQKKHDALKVLNVGPLEVTTDEADLIDLCVKSQLLEQLQHRYNRSSDVLFDELNEHVQTVIASVAFQYGNLATRCPAFWQTAITQDWQAMDAELCNFGDRYPTRRKREADYLKLGS